MKNEPFSKNYKINSVNVSFGGVKNLDNTPLNESEAKRLLESFSEFLTNRKNK